MRRLESAAAKVQGVEGAALMMETDFFIQGPDLGQGTGRGRGSDLTTRTGSQRPTTHFFIFVYFSKKTVENLSKSYKQLQNHEKNIGKVTKTKEM